MKNKLLIIAAIVALPLMALASGKHSHGHGAATQKQVTLTGEILDLACYMQHPKNGQGPEHASCARQCINKGLPSGLKVGNQVYLLLAPGHESVTDLIVDLAGKQATVKGTVIDQSGLKVLVVASALENKSGR